MLTSAAVAAVETGFGGKGANQCVAAAKLGGKASMCAVRVSSVLMAVLHAASTVMVTKVGNDSFGRDTGACVCASRKQCAYDYHADPRWLCLSCSHKLRRVWRCPGRHSLDGRRCNWHRDDHRGCARKQRDRHRRWRKQPAYAHGGVGSVFWAPLHAAASASRALVCDSVVVTFDGIRVGHRLVVCDGVVVARANDRQVESFSPVISRAKVMMCQYEIAEATTLAALRLAKRLGVRSIFNTAPAAAALDPEFYTVTDILCANETEAETLTGECGRATHVRGGVLVPPSSIHACRRVLVRTLCRYCCGQRVVCHGSSGGVHAARLRLRGAHSRRQGVCVPSSPPLTRAAPASRLTPNADVDPNRYSLTLSRIAAVLLVQGAVVVDGRGATHVPAPVVEVVDTVGAGDCFVGAMALFLSREAPLPLVDAVRRAVVIASESVKRRGTQKSYPARSDLPAELLA